MLLRRQMDRCFDRYTQTDGRTDGRKGRRTDGWL